MNGTMLCTLSEEQQLFSKRAIQLAPAERLALLLKVKQYPIVRKRTSAEKQIKEMLDLYSLYCIILVQFFPNDVAEENYLLLSFMATQEIPQTAITAKLSKAFKMLSDYEDFEKRITAIQMLFDKYQDAFPDIYEKYNLEEIVATRISDMIRKTRQLCENDPLWVEEVMNRWGLY